MCIRDRIYAPHTTYRAHGPPTCTLTRNSAAIAPYQRVKRVIHGRLPPKVCGGDGFACRAWEPWALRARALTNLNMVAKASGPESGAWGGYRNWNNCLSELHNIRDFFLTEGRLKSRPWDPKKDE